MDEQKSKVEFNKRLNALNKEIDKVKNHYTQQQAKRNE